MPYRFFCWACYQALMWLPLHIGQRKFLLVWWALPFAGEWAYQDEHQWARR